MLGLKLSMFVKGDTGISFPPGHVFGERPADGTDNYEPK